MILNNILLYTENLTKNFQGIKAVNDINFKINNNEIRALIGPNGAGKTTFVSLLCGRIKSSKGKVFFNGVNISHLPVFTRISMGIGYTFQITSIFFNLTVSENVALALKNTRNEEKKSIVSEVSRKIIMCMLFSNSFYDLPFSKRRKKKYCI